MRQAGILAAAGIVALEEMIDRLAEDHENARRLAMGLAAIPEIELNPEDIQTNIIFFELSDDVPWTAADIADWSQRRARLSGGHSLLGGFERGRRTARPAKIGIGRLIVGLAYRRLGRGLTCKLRLVAENPARRES